MPVVLLRRSSPMDPTLSSESSILVSCLFPTLLCFRALILSISLKLLLLSILGIWPESESFRETPEAKPIPSSWNGKCVGGEDFDPSVHCNRKLIGARFYLRGFEETYGTIDFTRDPEYRSPRDYLGHGTHTASTAVGSVVRNVSGFFGLGRGTARGGAPLARLAVFKTCWGKDLEGVCTEADILAAFDDAIHDGVHVISASFGYSPPLSPFFESSADIGAFHAAERGISVVFSTGNDGPDPGVVQNVAPWAVSVAASTVDRSFPTRIVIDGSFTLTVLPLNPVVRVKLLKD